MNNKILQILSLTPCLQIEELRSVMYVNKRKEKQRFVIFDKKTL